VLLKTHTVSRLGHVHKFTRISAASNEVLTREKIDQ
jgi:hypothetical protein